MVFQFCKTIVMALRVFYFFYKFCLMNIEFSFKNKEYKIERYPKTENRSLKSWNAADELLLQHVEELVLGNTSIAIYNDRFGFLSTMLNEFSPSIIINYKSQEKAIQKNLNANKLDFITMQFRTPLDSLPKGIDLGVFKIPKSMELFRLQLAQIAATLDEEGIVLGGFMTKYFTPQMLDIANEFFEEVEQSKAWKKSRVIILQKKKKQKEHSIINSISFQGEIFQQYFGVFSAKNIDYASQFFIENLNIKENEKRVLDLASGNGVLAKMVELKQYASEIHLMDDSYLAIESSKLNLNSGNLFFHFSDSMDVFKNDFFDVVISNPPFHFEFETNIEVALELFREVKRCLKEEGRFLLVASQHLNFKTHLIKLFQEVNIISENDKFVIYECK